ncbi:transcription factor [Lambiella insularis]|nr:transcription factor [Lambiella insularis]
MPPTANRRSERKRAATSRKVEAAESSPSRPSKKRKAATAGRNPPKREIQDAQMDNQDDDSSDAAETTSLTAAADEIIPFLREASYLVVVGLEYPNNPSDDVDEGNIRAFAKIAGKNWTYYVKEESINIGRSPDGGAAKHSTDMVSQSSPAPPGEDVVVAHIDLGPHKLVSRVHARCFFDYDDERWHILVNGRNGVRVNDVLLKKSQQKRLNSGDVIEIAGTEMIFVSPDVNAVVDPKYRARLDDPIKEEEPTAFNNQPHAHPELPSHAFVAPVQPLAQTFTPTPSYINGQPAIASTPSTFLRPTTPTKPFAPVPLPPTKSPYGQTVLLESNEKIDYSSDAMKDVKPPCSYSTLIGQAILSVPEEKMSLSSIYDWIKTHFSYYRHMDGGWQNSIRHNLSLNQSFTKIPRGTHEPGKGGMWVITDEKKEQIKADGLKMTSRGGARRSSAPNSPAPKKSPRKTPPKTVTGSPSAGFKTFPTDCTPPLTAYPPTAQESFTPSRGPRVSALGHADSHILPQLSDDASPLPNRSYLSRNAAAAGSPPTLSSSAYYNEDHPSAYSLFTPAPQRHEPRMVAPSTAKLPSQYLPQSSPAPFWKFNGHLDSTPARMPDSSPVKAGGPTLAIPTQSSSPPPAIANGSPTRARGNPVEPTLSGPNTVLGLGINSGHNGAEDEEDEDDGQLDLMG